MKVRYITVYSLSALVDKLKMEPDMITNLMPLAKDATTKRQFFTFLNGIVLTGTLLDLN
jgi:hypothetical protein